MDINAFSRRYDNGAGFWNRAGDNHIVQQEIDQGGGMKQMAADYLTLSTPEQDQARKMIDIDPWFQFVPTVGAMQSEKLESTIPTTGPRVDPQVEAAAHQTWTAALRGAYAQVVEGHNWRTCPFKLNFAPFFQKQDGSIDIPAAKISFRRWFDNAKLQFPKPESQFLFIMSVSDDAIMMKVGVNHGRYFPPVVMP
jgi:hypothetical protein